MHRLYLDGNQAEYQMLKFSGGEVHVKLKEHPGEVDWGTPIAKRANILAHVRSSDQMMELFLLTDALRTRYGKNLEINLQLPYIPYARQDRPCAEGEAFSLKVFAKLLNSQHYNSVIVWDPHSDVAPALIHDVHVHHQKVFVDRCFGKDMLDRSRTVLVSPDGGALKKIMDVAQWTRIKDLVRADKKRDVQTGAITETVVFSEHVGDKDFLIVDDICDGGRTFIELAKVLKPLTDGKLFLYVTHGIFSQGLTKLLEHFDHIYTANCFLGDSVHGKLTQVSL